MFSSVGSHYYLENFKGKLREVKICWIFAIYAGTLCITPALLLNKLSTEAEFRCQGDFLYQDDSQDINYHLHPHQAVVTGRIYLMNLFNTDMVVDDCLKKKTHYNTTSMF